MIALVLTLGLLFLTAFSVHPAAAGIGETYSVTANPGRIQETKGPVQLVLNVTNASVPSSYTFLWSVTDPSGSSKTTVKSTPSTVATWLMTVNYPNDFNTNITLAGSYFLNVTQTLPSSRPAVATATFVVGLTDKTSYNRTFTADIRASGYLPTDTVTLKIISGSSIMPGFPVTNTTALDGSFLYRWNISYSFPVGTYNVSLSGRMSPPKAVPDLQSVRVSPVAVSVLSFSIFQPNVQRTGTLDFVVTSIYASGIQVRTGTLTVQVGPVTGAQAIGAYNQTTGNFIAFYKIPTSFPSGNWNSSISPNAIDDGYGNTGPLSQVFSIVSVSPARLNVIPTISKSNFGTGDTVVMTATITTPDGALFNTGTAAVYISSGSRQVGSPVQMAYDASRSSWIGSYTPASQDPSGTWTFTVTASDAYGNVGNGAVLGVASISPSLVSETYTWILPVIIIAALATVVVVLLAKRRVGTSNAVTLDVQSVKKQADEVRSDDFFKSLQSQLERKTAKWKTEQETKENSDG